MKLSYVPAALAVFAASGALATEGAHYFSADASVNSNGALVVSFDEAGVGQQTVQEKLTANGTAVYACINGGQNHPSASNKETTTTPVEKLGSFNPTKNGRVSGSLDAGPPSEGNFSCPSGQELAIACVKYTSPLLQDLTNGVQIVPTGTFARTLVSLKNDDSCPIP